MTKSGGQSPAPNSGGTCPPTSPPVIYVHDGRLATSSVEHVYEGEQQVDKDGGDGHENADDADPDRVATKSLCSLVIALSHA